MFTKAAGFIRELEKAGCPTPVSELFDATRLDLITRHASAYRDGFKKVAQIAPDDAWKPLTGAGLGAAAGGGLAFKLAPKVMGGGGRTRFLTTILGMLGGASLGRAVTRPSDSTVDTRLLTRGVDLQKRIRNQTLLRDEQTKSLAGVAKPTGTSPLSFDNGDPLRYYNQYMNSRQP